MTSLICKKRKNVLVELVLRENRLCSITFAYEIRHELFNIFLADVVHVSVTFVLEVMHQLLDIFTVCKHGSFGSLFFVKM